MKKILLFLLLPFYIFSTELWMVHRLICNKGEPFKIEIYFGEYGVRERPFFGKLILYITDPLGETYKIPLRRGDRGYSTIIIPDVSGMYYLKCVGMYFGDKFISTGSFFVESFMDRLMGSKVEGVRTRDGIRVVARNGTLKMMPPRVCGEGGWRIKDRRGRVILVKKGLASVAMPKDKVFLAIYTCGDWTFTYYNPGGG